MTDPSSRIPDTILFWRAKRLGLTASQALAYVRRHQGGIAPQPELEKGTDE